LTRPVFVLSLLVLLVVCPAFAADKAAPTVSITSPEPGITIASDTVEVTAVYSAPPGAAAKLVELVVDGLVVESAALDPAESSGLLTLTWQASGYLDGKHQVVMRVTDTKDRVAKRSIPVTLTRDLAQAEPIHLTSPRPGAKVAGRVPVTVDAPDASVVKYVIFLVDNVFKAMSNVRPFTYYWDTSGYLNGFHSLQAKAYLSDGGQALSRTIEVQVDNPSGATTLKPPPAPAAPEPEARPARAAEALLPPPVHSEAATPYSKTVEVSKAEIGAPGTAPYISPTGDLIQPPTTTLAARAGSDRPIEVATVAEPAKVSLSATAAGALIDAPPVPVADPVRVPAAEEIAAAPAVDAAVAGAPTQTVAPVEIAALPTPDAALERTPAQTSLAPAPEPGPAEAGPAEVAPAAVIAPPAPKPTATPVLSLPKPVLARAAAKPATAVAPAPKPVTMAPPKPVPAPKQIAMLPPRPVVLKPAPKLTAQPAPTTATYTVQPGDCLTGIAAAYHVSLYQVAQVNGLEPPYVIRVGQQLTLPQTGIYVNGKQLSADAPSLFVENGGRHLIPLRAVVERIGGAVTWEPAAHQAGAAARGHRVTVTIGHPQATVDGRPVTLTISPTLLADRTLVPARFLGDALDLTVTHAQGVTHIAAR